MKLVMSVYHEVRGELPGVMETYFCRTITYVGKREFFYDKILIA